MLVLLGTCMRYFLNIRTKDGLIPDPEGDEFADTDALFEHAKHVIADLERNYPADTPDETAIVPIALEVVDELGVLVFRLPVNQYNRL